MSRNAINIKGTRQGLVILLDTNRDFAELKSGLKNIMETSHGFFAGARFILQSDKKLFPAEKSELEAICMEYGLIPNSEAAQQPGRRRGETSLASLPGEPALLVKKTLRSGQHVNYPGHVTVLGNVHPGAKITAGGSIIIMGNCSGFVHAGSNGDGSAFILAATMRQAHLRIAGIAMHETPLDLPYSPVKACIRHNRIVFTGYTGGNRLN